MQRCNSRTTLPSGWNGVPPPAVNRRRAYLVVSDGRGHMMGRNIWFGGMAIGVAGALWLAVSLLTSDYCSKWNPLSCRGPDPEMIKYTR